MREFRLNIRQGTDEDAAVRRTGLYRSPMFCDEAKRLADVQEMYLRRCIGELFEAGIIPAAGSDSLDAVARDVAGLIAALAKRSDSGSIAAEAGRMLSMQFRCEYGIGATDDREGRRTADVDHDRDTFGAQLARSIRGSFDDGVGSASDDCQFATAGRGPDRVELFGTLASPMSPADERFLYATKPVFASMHVGVRIVGIELDLIGAVTLTHGQMRRLARLMLADRELNPEPSLETKPRPPRPR